MIIKEIPGTQGYLATSDGRILDQDGVERNIYRNGDGYLTASVITTEGYWVTFGIQRLAALAHIPTDGDTSKLTVNHKDLDVENNNIRNLEWITSKLNNVHASIMDEPGNRPKILAKNPEGKLVFISNLPAAAELLLVDIDEAWEAIKSGHPVKGWTLKHHGTKDPIPDSLKRAVIQHRNIFGRPDERRVKAKDVVSDEVLLFSSLNDAAREFGVSASHIHQTITKDGVLRLFRKRWLITYDGHDFPTLTEAQLLELTGRGAKEVLAWNLSLGKFHEFVSASAFIKTHGLSKKAVSVALKNNTIRDIGGWLCVYKTPENIEALKMYLESPVP